MFTRIVLAIDGSDTSKKGIPAAADVAKHYGAEILVLHIRERELSMMGSVDLETPAAALDLVDEVVSELKDAGVSARGEVREAPLGRVPAIIIEFAREEDAGLIVMGSRGLSDWSGIFLGSVTHRVLHLATIPVLVVR